MNGIGCQQCVQNNQGIVIQNCQCYANQNRSLDPGLVSNYFITEYYKNTSNHGWNNTMYLFDTNCSVICKNKHLGNEYDLLHMLLTENIKKASYDKVRSGWAITGSDSMTIHVFGNIQFTTFNDRNTKTLPFMELFVLKIIGSNIKCVHHVFNF
jgi:hypothetical protein